MAIGTLSGDLVLARDPAAVTRRLGRETVIVPVRNNVADLVSIYTLNETGSFIWDRCDGSAPLQEVVAGVVATFSVDADQAWQDATELVNDLLDEGLLVRR